MIRRLILCAAMLVAGAAAADDFPMTISHKFGETVIEAQPQRVATVDFAGADDLLALGVQPVAIRHWYGDQEGALWPWVTPKLASSPEILRGEINYEQIARADPDVILALWSGITAGDYEQLSRIAPVVATPAGMGDFELPWDRRSRIAGRAIGREAEADAQIAAINARLEVIASEHPAWDGKTASVAYAMNGSPGAYTARDIRVQLLAQMGFVQPPALIAAKGQDASFALTLSEEALNVLDADVILWMSATGDFSAIDALLTRRFLSAASQGREVLAGEVMTGALSHASLLSLPFALDALVPAIEAALAGEGPVALP
ncbi:ABC transporter substrate-binding protein [Roseovarius sp. D0-M9]|uniref:ABC transporter substrate-binding protein n=1 Tax=Roseovarius sp. D0-M9 TaxID=3127117 RepID=UPI00300FF153